MNVTQINLELDNAALLRLVARAKEAWPDSSLGVSKRSKPEYKQLTVELPKGKDKKIKVASLPWSSGKTLLEWGAGTPALDALQTAVIVALPAGNWVLAAWANELKRGDEVDEHDHCLSGKKTELGRPIENAYAAIYYVQAPKGAKIKFDGMDALDVTTGLLLLFPASLRHLVPYYDMPQDRISIAFNIRPA